MCPQPTEEGERNHHPLHLFGFIGVLLVGVLVLIGVVSIAKNFKQDKAASSPTSTDGFEVDTCTAWETYEWAVLSDPDAQRLLTLGFDVPIPPPEKMLRARRCVTATASSYDGQYLTTPLPISLRANKDPAEKG